jgi:hypothetical protein
MRRHSIKAFFIAAAAIAVLAVACGGDDDDTTAEGAGAAGGAAGGGGTIPVTQALLDSLPAYEGATLVREWLAEGNSVQVREYAVAQEPAQAADAVTRHVRDALVANGWTESEARAAVSQFTKDGRSIVLGRVGPQLQEPPSGTTLLNTAEPPAGTAFYFTLEAHE